MTVTTSVTIILELQQAIHNKLEETPEFNAFVHGIYDDVPEDTLYPYSSFASHTEIPWTCFRQGGADVLFFIDVWSDFAGDEECYQILAILNNALTNTEDGPQFSLPSFHLVKFDYDWSTVLEETDPNSLQTLRHMPVRYHALAHV